MKHVLFNILHFALLSFLITVCKSLSNAKVTILHTNDIHMHFDEAGASPRACLNGAKCHGGVARLVKYIQTLDGLRLNRLVVDSGGMIDGTIMQDESGKAVVTDLVKPLPYDAMAFGSFELAGGIDALAEYVKIVGQKFVCTNLEFSDSLENGKFLAGACHKSMVKMFGALQIGILSYISADTMKKPVPGITILDGVKALKEEIEHLQLASSDIKVIVVLGFSDELLDTSLLKKVPGISLLISGHSHAMFYNGEPPNGAYRDFSYPETVRPGGNTSSGVTNVMVAGAYFHLLYVGMLQLVIHDMKVLKTDPAFRHNPVFLRGAKDVATERLVEKHRTTITAMLGSRIGHSVFLLDGSRACWSAECSMGNLLTDAMVDAVVQADEPPPAGVWSHTGTALLESGAISSSIERGVVSDLDLSDALRRDTALELLRITGAELKDLLHNMITRMLSGPSRHFLQVSGLQLEAVVDDTRVHHIGNTSLLCTECDFPMYEPLLPNTVYSVAVTRKFAARETAPGGRLGGAGRTPLRDSLINVARAYMKKISPVMVATGDRLMVTRLPMRAAGAAGPAVSGGCLAAALFVVRAVSGL